MDKTLAQIFMAVVVIGIIATMIEATNVALADSLYGVAGIGMYVVGSILALRVWVRENEKGVKEK
ncbi:MAG: hypothetical protein IPM48_15035 [Saprospiraceae bacterium]|nr:hypothetical protein [Saprospiraceae bacterium]